MISVHYVSLQALRLSLKMPPLVIDLVIARKSEACNPMVVIILKGVIMKKFIALALLVFSFASMAASVKVTSFNYVRNQNDQYHPLAELCGVVEGAASSPSFVQVLIDPKSKEPASYNTIAGKNGKFCLAVITFRGNAEVSLINENASTEAFIK